jgi:tetratricopeptide (TPR) repeat protein
MALRGNLSEASLADVLQLLALGQKTGCLSVAREGGFGTVHFAGGRIVHAELVSRRDRLGDRLVRVGAITPDALARVTAASAPQDDRELAHALLAAGLLAREQLVGAYRTQVEEAVYHLFSWSLGSFTFEPEADHLPDTALVSMSADSLLLEGARRVDEWTQIAKKVPSLDLIFELNGARLARRAVPLSATQERIRTFLDGTQDLNTAIERSGLGEFEVGKAVFGLVTAGYAQCVGRSAARRQAPSESCVAEHRNLGIAFYRAGMLDEAQRAFRRVLELREADGVSRFHLGLVQLRQRDWAGAYATFLRASQEPEAPAAVLHNLAFVCEQRGDLGAAAGFLDEAMRRVVVPDPRIALSRATLALRVGDLASGESALAEARTAWGARQPSAAWFHVAGLAAALGGDTARAAAVLEEGLTLYPHAAALHNNLAVVQERRGNHELAARTIEHALLEDANCAHLHKNLGDYLYRVQRYDEAFESFVRVVRLMPSHGPDVYLKLGNIHYRSGALAEARASWEQALALAPDHTIVRANLDAMRRSTPSAAEPFAARDGGAAATLRAWWQ